MFRPLVEGGRGLFDLELPSTPGQAWLDAELARFSWPPPTPLTHPLGWSPEPFNEHSFSNTTCASVSCSIEEKFNEQILNEGNLGRLNQIYLTILKNTEEKANRVESIKNLSNIPPAFTSSSSWDTYAGNFTIPIDKNGSKNISIQDHDQTFIKNSKSSRLGLLAIHQKETVRTKGNYCGFCRSNGEMSKIYNGHSLRDSAGHLTCAALRNYKCPICGETGDNAHTASYCPFGRRNTFSPIAKKLKGTKRNSTSQRRRPFFRFQLHHSIPSSFV